MSWLFRLLACIVLCGTLWRQGVGQTLADSLEQKGEQLLGERAYPEAREAYQAALESWAVEGDSAAIARMYAKLAYLHINNFELDSANSLLDIALGIQERNLPPNDPELATTLYYLGQSAFRAKDHATAREYLEACLRIRKELLGPQHRTLAPVLEMLALCYWRNLQPGEAASTQLSAISLLSDAPPRRLSGSYLNLGMFQADARQISAAEISFTTALEMRKTALGPNHPQLGQIYQNLGLLQLQNGQVTASLPNFEKGYELALKAFPPFHPIPARFATNLAHGYRELEQWEIAIRWHQTALEHLLPNWQGDDPTTSLPEGLSPLAGELVEAVREKGLTLLAEQQVRRNPSKEALELCLQQFLQAANLIDSMRLGFQAETSKLTYGSRARQVYEGGIEAAWLLYQQTSSPRYINEAFRLAERARAMVLVEAIQRLGNQEAGQLSAATREEEQKLRQQISQLQQQLLEGENRKKPSEILDSLKSELFAARQQMNAFRQRLARDYPAYHRLRYQVEVMDPEAVHHLLLDEQTALVEYFLGREHLHTFRVFQGEVAWYRSEHSPNLRAQIEAFRQGLEPAHWQQDGSSLTDSLGIVLYQQLWQALLEWDNSPRQLILVPDEYLAYLPFDALLEEKPMEAGQYQTYPFLGKTHQLSYAYSATWLYELQSIQRLANQQHQWIGMAPTTFSRLGDLPFSRSEIEEIHNRYGGKALLGERASRAAFLRWAPETRLLHLSTHAGLHDSIPELSAIYFAAGDSVSLQEIAAMQIPADLVVLSACETGIGELKSGEGLLSLGRAFSQAGAKSLLTTLWQVNDATTQQVMERFYTALSEQKNKAEALHFAKMEQLNQHDPILSHPYFWAGYSIWGERTKATISPRTPTPYWLIGAILLILLAVGWGIYRRATAK